MKAKDLAPVEILKQTHMPYDVALKRQLIVMRNNMEALSKEEFIKMYSEIITNLKEEVFDWQKAFYGDINE